jgi:hypothetical protein
MKHIRQGDGRETGKKAPNIIFSGEGGGRGHLGKPLEKFSWDSPITES